jgi:hypothetical protein
LKLVFTLHCFLIEFSFGLFLSSFYWHFVDFIWFLVFMVFVVFWSFKSFWIVEKLFNCSKTFDVVHAPHRMFLLHLFL